MDMKVRGSPALGEEVALRASNTLIGPRFCSVPCHSRQDEISLFLNFIDLPHLPQLLCPETRANTGPRYRESKQSENNKSSFFLLPGHFMGERGGSGQTVCNRPSSGHLQSASEGSGGRSQKVGSPLSSSPGFLHDKAH
jgi:hypothetical protein